MASIPPLPTDDAFLSAVTATLSAGIRSTLKGPLMEIAEAEVDKAVDKAMAELDIRIKAWMDTYDMGTTIKVIFERKEAAQ
ncbi:MAG: hypothetical protein WC829_06965 [Hyphomicrobium sp.]|jgi:hypothetical protein